MQKHTIALAAGALLFLSAGAMLVPQWLADDDVPLVRWDAKDEVEVAAAEADAESGSALASNGVERIAVEGDGGGALPDEARVALILRGRVVDKFQVPVAAATVWLDFGRGGQRGGGPGARQRRVPDPVQSDRDGRFAFQGQTFRNLRVSLQVAHSTHSPGLFDKDLGEVTAEVDLGDLVLTNGGEVLGRVTDLEGNGIAGASIDLGPDGNNRMRMVRNRENLMPKIETDSNGFYRRPHVMAGDWTASATAKMHTEGRSPTFVVEEDQLVEVEDIRLGPGFEVTGYVRTAQGQPIAKADVTMRSMNRGGRNGRGGPPGGAPGGAPVSAGPEDWRAMFGRDHSTTTDEQGRFFLEHLPSVPMHIETRADGYLDFDQEPIDPTLGQPVQVVMQDGLRIAGTVVDAVDNQAVSLFAVRATRVRGLPVAGQGDANIQELVTRMRDGNLDEATRTQLRAQLESLRGTAGAEFGRGGRGGNGGPGGRGGNDQNGGPGGRGPARDLGKPEKHPGGTFVVTGLQEGIYEVSVQSPEHARFRSQEVEVRLGMSAPTVAASLERGFFVAGVVTSEKGTPVMGATVELRAASAFDAFARGRRGGRGGNGEAAAPGAPAATAAPGSGPGSSAGSAVDYQAMSREFQRAAAGTLVTLQATTDAEGVFVIKHAVPGSYRLQAQARGFADANGENFDLQADRSGLALQLGLLGSVTGHVRGLRSNEMADAHVAAMQIGGGFGGMRGMGRGREGQGGGGPFNSVSVQPDGTYRIDDLVPGDYIVRSWVGSPQEIMRELGPQFAANTLTADIKVKGGEVANLDLTVVRPQIGEVAGTVQHNGAPATGFRVELSLVEETAAAQPGGRGGRGQGGPGGNRGGGPNMFGGGRSFQATVASSGNFSIKEVPAGSYRLRVQPARRGGVLHEETVLVVADATTERNLQVSTASLRGSVTRDDNGNVAELNGNVTLLAGLTVMPENLQAWRREPGNSSFDARVQNGAFKFETLKPDNYLLVLTIRGRERTSLPVGVAAGSEQPIVVAAGKVAASAPANGGNSGQPARPNGTAGR